MGYHMFLGLQASSTKDPTLRASGPNLSETPMQMHYWGCNTLAMRSLMHRWVPLNTFGVQEGTSEVPNIRAPYQDPK